jgi:hypothetical protein
VGDSFTACLSLEYLRQFKEKERIVKTLCLHESQENILSISLPDRIDKQTRENFEKVSHTTVSQS